MAITYFGFLYISLAKYLRLRSYRPSREKGLTFFSFSEIYHVQPESGLAVPLVELQIIDNIQRVAHFRLIRAEPKGHRIPDHAVLLQFESEMAVITPHRAAADHFHIAGDESRLGISLPEWRQLLNGAVGAACEFFQRDLGVDIDFRSEVDTGQFGFREFYKPFLKERQIMSQYHETGGAGMSAELDKQLAAFCQRVDQIELRNTAAATGADFFTGSDDH